MENLPNELLSAIFGFLHPVYNGMARFSAVCHRWNEVIHQTPSLWEHIHLKLEQLTKREKRIVFRCLRKFEVFIRCLRVPVLDVVFGYDFRFFIRLVTLEMTNITCLDVPTFPWNLEQFVALKSAENLKELNLYGFWDLSDIQWTQSYSQPVSLINQGHLQLLKVRCAKLEVLKLSVNMIRSSEKALMDFLNALKLKELHISAYNSDDTNVQINRNGVKLLKCLLSSRYVSIVSKLDLQYVSIGHKELRLLLKVLSSLRFLKLRFLDVYRCMTGYQYLQSKSLEHFELHNLPAKNIVNLKCSMPKLRRFMLSGCSSLRSLQVISCVLQRLFLNFLASLQSLYVTSTTLKFLEVGNCESLTSETIHTVLQSNERIQHCTIRGHLTNFQLSRTEASCVLTELRLWIANVWKVQRIQVHCPTLKSFMCNNHDPDAEFSLPAREPACVDLRCNDLLDAFIGLPRITSIDIRCKTIAHLLLNVGQQKLEMPCSVIRIEAEDNLKTFGAHKCIFNRIEIKAKKIDNLDFHRCRIKGALKMEVGLTDVICMRNLVESQINVDLIAQCSEIKKLILQECESLCTVTVFPDEKHLYKSFMKSSTDSFIVHNNCCYQEGQEIERQGICSTLKNPVDTVSTSHCPCFLGLRSFRTTETPSELQGSASCNELVSRGTSTAIQKVKLVLSSEDYSELPRREIGFCNHHYNGRSALSCSFTPDCQQNKEEKNECSIMSRTNLNCFNQEQLCEQKDASRDSVRLLSPLSGAPVERTCLSEPGLMTTDQQGKNSLDSDVYHGASCSDFAVRTCYKPERGEHKEINLTSSCSESKPELVNGKSNAI